MKENILHWRWLARLAFSTVWNPQPRQGKNTAALGLMGVLMSLLLLPCTNQLLLGPTVSSSLEGRRPGHLQAPSRGTYG